MAPDTERAPRLVHAGRRVAQLCAAVEQSRQSARKWSGRAGLNYLFDNGVAPYISHATSFDPVLGNDFSGSPFVPTEARQSEIGIKYHPPGPPRC